MRDLDPESILLELLQSAPELDGIDIYAGWPEWEVPPGLQITVSMQDIPLDDTVDITGNALELTALVWVNVWGTDDSQTWDTARKVHNMLQHLEHEMPEGASLWIWVPDMKPMHEHDPAGTIYRYYLDVRMKTMEKIGV